jgi:UDP-glucose 4-epimerase
MQKSSTLVVGDAGYIGSHMVLNLLRVDSSRLREQSGWQQRYDNIRYIIASDQDWHRKKAGL